ncbi:response regulator transcription factor [Alkaliphilus peptidifermentans]|uniref:Stage 0 sporulation protein A homolog n=1 Tax=Alkaliphilus peptidifermentans DSM 18978 TaxID=1120976 RepID=A0A1G5H9J4_9FIRM|nr:response regulator transcription factor [Alkaliphilus peptidifermentans]SCY60456.1 DNA-binding response regulator, OmpR family, contains REC and winged-helix (wHTH) domain [Alkaliphilus peptidifermentans DSM 18978]
MDKEKILIVDDEKEIADLIEIYLANEGYQVYKANTGIEALEKLEKEAIQLVILDIMMPGIDGLETCRRIRKVRNIPILMLSAKSEDMDKVMGLTTGADDYMTKPFNPMELLARVKSQLRRFITFNRQYDNGGEENVISVNGLVINKETHKVSLFNQEISLTPIEFDILYLLAKHPGKVFTVDAIFQNVWKEDYLESDNTVRVHIRKLREKLESDPKKPFLIKTVWGVGYKVENETSIKY